MARLFGVRDIALGALVLRTREEPALTRYVFKLNAWCDAGDLAAMLVAIGGRQGIDRAACRAPSWHRLERPPGWPCYA